MRTVGIWLERGSVLAVPDALQVSSKEVLVFKARARGVQIYKCQVSKKKIPVNLSGRL